LDVEVRRGATADRGRVDLATGLRSRPRVELGSAVGAAQRIFAKEG